MDARIALLSIALGTVLILAVVLICCRLVTWARQRNARGYVVGALFGPFMAMGHVVDPDFRIVHEAKRGRETKENDGGDPPTHEDEGGEGDGAGGAGRASRA
jgi:uncharacterized sodium:solute symporter family permease YidK